MLWYSICLWNSLSMLNMSSTLRDDALQWYFERWFLCSASLRDTNFKYWIEIWVLCQRENLETAKLGWLTMLEKYHLLSSMWLVKAVKIFSRILCSFCIHLLFYGHVLVSSYYEFLSPWCDLPVNFWLLGVSSLDLMSSIL